MKITREIIVIDQMIESSGNSDTDQMIESSGQYHYYFPSDFHRQILRMFDGFPLASHGYARASLS